jgi:8-oxo-dGTP diphosphatase
MPSTEADAVPIINPRSIDGEYIHVVAGIIWQQGTERRFLLAQRQKGKHLQDFWEFPGGKMEVGETPWQALQRELEEEINIQPNNGSPFMQVYCRYPERNILLDTWVVADYRGEVAPAEGQLLQWITIDEVTGYRLPPADIPVIDAIKSSETARTQCLP